MATSSRVHIFYDSKADSAVLSGGSWLSACPLSSIQTKDYSEVARSTDASLASTRINIALSSVYAVRGIMFRMENATARAKFRCIRTDATFTDAYYTTPWMNIGVQVPFGTLPYGSPWLYDGYVAWDDPDRSPWAISVYDKRFGGRYWQVQIDDVDNPDGYLDISRLYVWDAYVPTLNYVYGNNGLSLTDNSISSKAVGGARHVLRLPNKKRWQCQLDLLPESEAYGAFWHMLNISGFDRECFVVPDPNDTVNLQTRSFAGRFVQPDPIAQTFFRRAGSGFGIEEL
ncbi:MAG: hypothetical protein M9944_08085 [Rhizobiaceae bacterium]|nr:hypothetical protein [Rhizobiaceae bacterium]